MIKMPWLGTLRHVFEGKHRGIQMTVALAFTLVAGVIMILLGIILYGQFYIRASSMMSEASERFLSQTKRSFEDYLRTIRRISDAMYYTAIKNTDMAEDSLDEELNLIYESSKDSLVGIALYSQRGELVSAVPVSTQKEGLDVTVQPWFVRAVGQVENLQYSTPHVQNLFEEPMGQYHWVISMSRAVELNRSGVPEMGVLLVDMNFSSVQQILEKANSGNSEEYIYLCDQDGGIIYHPKLRLINAGLFEEDNYTMADRSDGTYLDNFNGENRLSVIKTVSYTGWKLISVIPVSGYGVGMGRMQYLVVLIISMSILGVVIINQFVSTGITGPLVRLDNSVEGLERGDLESEIYIGGPREVEHLGRTLESSVYTIKGLMKDLVSEQEEKRESELDALQSQINPHFLYNTLDSVIWMIEGRHNDEAVYMIKQLARLLRISISHGRTIISLGDELNHARSYMNIQKIRYKNTFQVNFDVPEELLSCCTVKLILQPLLENAIYYGVQGMDGDGEITVRGRRTGDDVYIEVEDNGLGIPEEILDVLLDRERRGEASSCSHGNGVGLINVHTRIQLRFGADYGLRVESEPDEGTTVSIHLPFIEYSDDVEGGMSSSDKLGREMG